MFCPKCGTSVENEIKVCPKCGLDFETVEQPKEPNQEKQTVVENLSPVENPIAKDSNSIIKFAFWGLAVIVLIMFFMAASSIAEGGNEIMQIQSVGGKTLEEAYYAELGAIYSGYAMIARAVGIFFASVLVWLGLKK